MARLVFLRVSAQSQLSFVSSLGWGFRSASDTSRPLSISREMKWPSLPWSTLSYWDSLLPGLARCLVMSHGGSDALRFFFAHGRQRKGQSPIRAHNVWPVANQSNSGLHFVPSAVTLSPNERAAQPQLRTRCTVLNAPFSELVLRIPLFLLSGRPFCPVGQAVV